jgi:hypothetical protein
MKLLTPAEVRAWFLGSLAASGFSDLTSLGREIWKGAVRQGRPGLPPGFIGRLIEALAHRAAGPRTAQALREDEERFLQLLRQNPGFEQLEGMFLLKEETEVNRLLPGVTYQLLDRLPSFDVPELNCSPIDLDQGLNPETKPDAQFPVQTWLSRIYGQALAALGRAPLHLSPADVFEISHPHLFPRPADRTFYHRLTSAMQGLQVWSSHAFSLPEDPPGLVARFGEPHVLPLGGYDALTTRGTIGSLVPSELAFIDPELEVDLFDYKFLENQLLYFQREEGAVFRLRREIRIFFELTPFFEHERFLGLLFAFCLVLGERLLDLLTKDSVLIRFVFSGHRASALSEAGAFCSHFLRERNLAERILLHLHGRPEMPQPSTRTQLWTVGPTPEPSAWSIPLQLPQDEGFAHSPTDDQERRLGDLITRIIAHMAGHARS